eukprot:TRINITY_DN1158_c4_g1_i1.p1 TRINITY_DN1158_c4_g1~~TRINITY_DN1158_c4_g1_i1.p1  ORF type:complete len:341 (+),score=78.81 TRINITY_DN1158_c4_g1_i1:62-1024(+)
MASSSPALPRSLSLPFALTLTLVLLTFTVTAVKVEGLEGDYVYTPVGIYPAHCHHEVRNGARIIEEADGTSTIVSTDGTYSLPVLEDCAPLIAPSLTEGKRQFPRDYDGWLTYTGDYHAAGYTAFYGNMSVPTTSPKVSPQVLFIFTGLQNIEWVPKRDPLPTGPFDIIQPVLQYPSNSGFNWSVKSWYVTLNNGVISSDEIPLKEGEVFYSEMKKTGPTSWVISASNSLGQETTIYPSEPRLALQPWAYNTVEAYGASNCDHLPTSPTMFTQLSLEDENGKVIVPNWKVEGGNTVCKESAVVHSPSAITFYFQEDHSAL